MDRTPFLQANIKVFTGKAHPTLAQEICQYLEIPLSKAESFKFKNDNTFVQIQENVRQRDCYVVQPSCTPVNDGIIELLMMVDALKRASARSITVVTPYFPYGRSDKKDQPRIPITASLIASLLETAGAQRVLTMDLHAEQIQGFFKIPVDQLMAAPVICRYFQDKRIPDLVAVAPDAGSAKRTRTFAARMNIPMAIVDKRRDGNSDSAQATQVVGNVEKKNVIIFDDEISTGGSMVSAVEALKEAGASMVYAAVTHPILCGDANRRIRESVLEELVVTNTVPIDLRTKADKIKILSVGGLIAEAIARISEGQSLNDLFR